MTRSMKPISSPRYVRGISLIEVMVSVMVLAVGMLGIAAMQSVALRGGQGSLESSQAVMQTNSIIEAMRANSGNVLSYNMPAMACAAPGGGTLEENDIRDWILSLKATIGAGVGDATTCGQIVCPGNTCTVTVRWDDSRAGGGATRTIVTEARI